MFTHEDGEGSLQIRPECKFLLRAVYQHHCPPISFIFIYFGVFFFGGGGGREGERERVDFILPFPFGSLIQADVNKLFVEAFCVNVREESRLPTISDPVSE
jgi:hypothetical protein